MYVLIHSRCRLLFLAVFVKSSALQCRGKHEEKYFKKRRRYRLVRVSMLDNFSTVSFPGLWNGVYVLHIYM